MNTQFSIQSSDTMLLEKASRVAEEFVQPYMREGIVGIVFLGAITRGYFDRSADIDIALFTDEGAESSAESQFTEVDGIEVHCWLSDYDSELNNHWDMSRRWAYSQGHIRYDPSGKISELLTQKVPLQPEEKRWLMMSGLCMSEWYVNRLTLTWMERGNIISAHHMVSQGLIYFFDMLFGLNDQLVADMKWRYYCVEQLDRLPGNFRDLTSNAMILHSFSAEELNRRQESFMQMWREMKPIIEDELQLSYEEILQLV